MKRVLLVEIDLPEEEKNPKEWLRDLLSEYKAQVRHLRYKDFDDYDNEDYWRYG